MSYSASQMRTQKARGLVALMNSAALFSPVARVPIAGEVEILPHRAPSMQGFNDLFARPCPITPRHGFVESRGVGSLEALLNVYIEARAADPEAEVIVMPRLSGKASAVATDAGVTWGLGHDGATSGTGKLWHIPAGGEPGAFNKTLSTGVYGGGGVTDNAYLELVEHAGQMQLVQLRDGPAQPRGLVKNYVPGPDYKVTAILKPTGDHRWDMLGWEKAVNASPPGTVILFQDGSLSSHIAVHGIAHGFAVLTDYKVAPEVDSILQPPADAVKVLSGAAYSTMAKYITDVADKIAFSKSQGLTNGAPADIALSTAILHSLVQWDDSEHLLKLRAFGAVAMCKFLGAACIGEARHFPNSGPGRFKVKPATPWPDIMGSQIGSKGTWSRSHVYGETLQLPLSRMEPGVIGAWRDFGGNWRGMSQVQFEADTSNVKDRHGVLNYQDGTGVGGWKWRQSANIARKLCKALRRFVNVPGPESWAKVVKQYNLATACAHNNGRLLDKFTNFALIDRAARAPSFAFISSRVMQVVTGIDMEATFSSAKQKTTASFLAPGNIWWTPNIQGPKAAWTALDNDCRCPSCKQGLLDDYLSKVKAMKKAITVSAVVTDEDTVTVTAAQKIGVIIIDNSGPLTVQVEAVNIPEATPPTVQDAFGKTWISGPDGWSVQDDLLSVPVDPTLEYPWNKVPVLKVKAKQKVPKPTKQNPPGIAKPSKGKKVKGPPNDNF